VVLGMRFWPAIMLGAFVVNITTKGDVATSLAIAIGNTAEALAGALLVNRFAGGRRAFDTASSYLRFVLMATLCTTIGASIGANSLVLGGSATWNEFNPIWLTWWLGDAVGAIVLTPLIVLWIDSARSRRTRLVAFEAVALLLSVAIIGALCFGPSPWGAKNYPLTFLPMLSLAWAAFRFGPRATATVSLLEGSIAIWGTINGFGPFVPVGRISPHESLLVLQVFVCFMSATALALALIVKENKASAAALRLTHEQLEQQVHERTANLSTANAGLLAEVAERQLAQKQLAESEAQFRDFLESAPDAVLIVGQDGLIRIVNSQTEKFFGFRREELIGQPVELLIPERLRDRHLANRRGFFANPHVRSMGEGMDLFGRRKDGSEFAVDISLSPLTTKDGTMVSAAIRDVTRRRRAEHERRANEKLRIQVEELSRRTREIATLNRMSDMLRALTRVVEAWPLIPPFLSELFPDDSGALYAFNPSHSFLEAVAVWGKTPPGEDVFMPDECWALRRGQSHGVGEQQVAAACQHLRAPIPAATICIPMMAQGEAIGLFHLCGAAEVSRGDGEAHLGEYKLRLAQAAAEQIGGAIANAKLHETLRLQASRDPLTGLLNRRTFEESMDRDLHRAARHKSELAVIMVDIDHFKRFNDRFGHAAGDVALREIGTFLLAHARKEDIICRFGGEELTIVLGDCGRTGVKRRAEQIREGVKTLQLEHDGRLLGKVSMSLGVALFPEHGCTREQLLLAADAALYQAKHEGRDRVVIAAPLPAAKAPKSTAREAAGS
jgi:diguanylate cyclase (GGDEF)-like protein/PAS domain S-box-containing protein